MWKGDYEAEEKVKKAAAAVCFNIYIYIYTYAHYPSMLLGSLRKFVTNFSQSSLQSRPNLSKASPKCKLKCDSYANLFIEFAALFFIL